MADLTEKKKRTGLTRFTASEISEIIQSCSQGNVRSFNYNGLVLELEGSSHIVDAKEDVNVSHLTEHDLLGNSYIEDSPLSKLQDSEEYLEDLDITDPEAFEAHIQSKDAVN